MKYMVAILLLVAAMSAQNAPSTNKAGRLDIPAISREANGAVVSIIMSDRNGHPITQGSGFLISKDGHVVTNYHVIRDGVSAVVKLPNGASFHVDGVLASDKNRDVAIIKAHGVDFRTLSLGDSGRLQVGEDVVAIGNPLLLESTVSNGIVSAFRTDEDEGKFVQITAPISPGSSGGPLFNMAGKVVGITTSHIEGGENLNFAIPINDIKPMLLARSPRAHAFPNEADLDETVKAASATFHLDPDILSIVLNAGTELNQPPVSPQSAARHLRELLERFNFDLVLALAAYKVGPERVEQYSGVPPEAEVRAYVARIVHEYNTKKIAQQRY